jgi:hypothetical protein
MVGTSRATVPRVVTELKEPAGPRQEAKRYPAPTE